jgi:2-polyprenyl-6-methoxyphenol hydroxylase-like FAD-dependent oxidoreductase
MKTEATDVIEADGSVVGVRARGDDGTSRDILADVVIAADGRGSVLRDRAGLTVEDLGAPMDALWFKVPAHPDDSDQTMGRFGAGYILVQLFRGDYWQCAYVIPKGALGNIQAKGIEAFRDLIFEAGPFDRERLKAIRSWDDVKLLTVRVDRLKTWYRPGFLAIGDAAHAMSPIGGVGVNLAVQDAVAAANQLARPLREGTVSVSDLEAVQTRRMFPTRVIQAIQVAAQNNIIGPTLRLKEKPTPPFALRLMQRFPVLRRIPARVLGLGVRREHVAEFIRHAKG